MVKKISLIISVLASFTGFSCSINTKIPDVVSMYKLQLKDSVGYPEYILIYEPYHTMEIYTPYFASLKVTGNFTVRKDTLFFKPYLLSKLHDKEVVKYDTDKDFLDSLGLSYHPFNLPRQFLIKKKYLIEITTYNEETDWWYSRINQPFVKWYLYNSIMIPKNIIKRKFKKTK